MMVRIHVYMPVYVVVSGEKMRLTPSLDILSSSSSSEMSNTVLLIVQVALVVISVSTDILRV